MITFAALVAQPLPLAHTTGIVSCEHVGQLFLLTKVHRGCLEMLAATYASQPYKLQILPLATPSHYTPAALRVTNYSFVGKGL